jgi:aminopeptidase N
MSTYLVAFLVSNFKTIRRQSERFKIDIEVSAREEAINNGEGNFALNEAGDIIDFYTEYFDIRYPLKKSSKITNLKCFKLSFCHMKFV